MNKDSNRFHGSVLLSTGNFENTISMTPGYTVKGRYTAGVDFGKGIDNVNEINSTIFRPHLSVLILKKDESEIPISIAVEAGYEVAILPTTSFNSSTLQLGSDLFYTLSIQNGVKIIPQIGILFEQPISKNGVNSEKDISTVTNLSVTAAWKDIYINTGFLLSSQNRAYYFSVGYII